MARKSAAEARAEKLAQLETLKADIQALEDREATRLGRLAIKAGIADLAIPDADLLTSLKELASRFRNNPQQSAPLPPPARHDHPKTREQSNLLDHAGQP